MKNLICALFIISCGSSYSQLEDYVTSYADTAFNTKNLIEKITITTIGGNPIGVAEYAYYDTDTLKSIDYKDEQGFLHHKYNEQGYLIFIHVNHYKSLGDHQYFDYDFAENGDVNVVYTYDSTKTLQHINSYKYNKDGFVYERITHSGAGDLLYISSYVYDTKGDIMGSETYLGSGLLRMRDVSASTSADGLMFKCSYTYDEKNQLEKINYYLYRANGDFDDSSFILFEHENGELTKFRIAGGEFQKIKKKHLENRWIKEYYFVIECNKKR